VKLLSFSFSPQDKAGKRRKERQGDGRCKHGGEATCGIAVQVSVELLGNHGGFNGGFDFRFGSNRCVPHHARFRL